MIRRVTPNKGLRRKEREASCCGSCDIGEDQQKERVVEFMPKVAMKDKWARTSAKLQLIGYEQMNFQTPKASMLPTRTNSINKNYMLSTAVEEEKHLLFSNITDDNIITLTYPATPVRARSKQSLQLQCDVQAYKDEYSGLLQQFRRLKKEKSCNRRYFQLLLDGIHHKEAMIRQAEQQRCQDMIQLRHQLAKLITQSH